MLDSVVDHLVPFLILLPLHCFNLKPLNLHPSQSSTPTTDTAVQLQSQTLPFDFTKPNLVNTCSNPSELSTIQFSKDSFSISPPLSSTNSSFMSSIIGDGSVYHLCSSLRRRPYPSRNHFPLRLTRSDGEPKFEIPVFLLEECWMHSTLAKKVLLSGG
ncbi:hypothetical protein NE237_022300 [Protea cynaroides]|uniref:Uncharacterized protein n=1 Tax=Protea cynaroides TaxID=273540 RepID=A0A9Q0H9D0_9MAGN|nr:hypothetical protein NE237_022300 [Protea cynaroides]